MPVKPRVTVVAGSGFVGGELARILLSHPDVELAQMTSRSLDGKAISVNHVNLRGCTDLVFSSPDTLEPCDVLFLCLPHGVASQTWETYENLSPRIIDLSADFRLANPAEYLRYYKKEHPRPDLLETFSYGLAELDRTGLMPRKSGSHRIAIGGCNASVSILTLLPLFRAGVVDLGRTVLEVKVGSSEGGRQPSGGSHHPFRSRAVRAFKPIGHRHTAEIVQALTTKHGKPEIHLSVTAVEMVRGAVVTGHIFTHQRLTTKRVWKIYREAYAQEPFIRLVAKRSGPYRLPEPGPMAGSNFCDIGFEVDPDSNRIVVVGAIDNLMKGAAGQAVQAMNLSLGFPETAGLTFPGLFPN